MREISARCIMSSIIIKTQIKMTASQKLVYNLNASHSYNTLIIRTTHNNAASEGCTLLLQNSSQLAWRWSGSVMQ